MKRQKWTVDGGDVRSKDGEVTVVMYFVIGHELNHPKRLILARRVARLLNADDRRHRWCRGDWVRMECRACGLTASTPERVVNLDRAGCKGKNK